MPDTAENSRVDQPPPDAPHGRDYSKIAIEYAKRAALKKNNKMFGRWIRLAAKRFLADLKKSRSSAGDFIYDPWYVDDCCSFIEKLPHVEGRWGTENLVLHESHVFFLAQLFGFRNRETGGRRFNTALFAVARKNAKSTLAAAVLVYLLCCEDEPGAQVISAATTGSQARIVWGIAKMMVDRTPALKEAFDIETYANAIKRFQNDGVSKPINAKASTQDGLNPSVVCLDEIHAHKDHDLLNVLKSAAGARQNPLFLYLTTEGYETPGPWPEQRKFAQQVLEGAVDADHYLALIYSLDDDDDDFDEAAWRKANPLMDVNPHLKKAIHDEAIEARQMPGRLAEFRIKRLNRQAQAAGAWVDLRRWDKCDGPVDLDTLTEAPCWGGLDLASTGDIASFRLVWLHDGRLYTHAWRWVPEECLRTRTERGTVPYAAWVVAGFIEQTPGNITDYTVIEERVRWAHEHFKIQNIAYDRWNASELIPRLVGKGIPLIEFVQGAKSFHPAMLALERAYMSGKLAHGGDPVLKWCISNVVPRYDVNMNMAPDKKRAPDKIDDAVALMMAVGLAAENVQPKRSVYEDRGVLEFPC